MTAIDFPSDLAEREAEMAGVDAQPPFALGSFVLDRRDPCWSARVVQCDLVDTRRGSHWRIEVDLSNGVRTAGPASGYIQAPDGWVDAPAFPASAIPAVESAYDGPIPPAELTGARDRDESHIRRREIARYHVAYEHWVRHHLWRADRARAIDQIAAISEHRVMYGALDHENRDYVRHSLRSIIADIRAGQNDRAVALCRDIAEELGIEISERSAA